MKDLERIREEIVTILVLILTLSFTSSNLTPESVEDDVARSSIFTEEMN